MGQEVLDDAGLRGVRWLLLSLALTGAIARVRAALSRGLGDPDEGVQDACCVPLMEIGDSAAVPALINHLERLVRSGAGLGRLRAVQTSLKRLTRTSVDLTSGWRGLWSELRDSRQG